MRKNGRNTSSRKRRRNARPVVVDVDRQEALVPQRLDGDVPGVDLRIADEIGEAALEGVRPQRDDGIAAIGDLDVEALAHGVETQLLEKVDHVDLHGALAGGAAGEGEIGLEHALHFGDVLLQLLRLLAVAHKGERQLEAGQNRAQVMADAVQHRGALLDGALDAALHLDEGETGPAHLARAARPEVAVAALAEFLRGAGERQNRLDLTAQENHGDDDEHEGRTDHPEQEDIGVRGVGGAAVGGDAQDRIVELDADFNEVRAPDGIQPERPADLAPDLARERRVDDLEERLRQRRRQRAQRQKIGVDLEPVLRDPCDLVVASGEGFMKIDDRRDVLRQRRRKPVGDELPVALHEDVGQHALQDDHRRDDDQRRAGIEPLGQDLDDSPPEPAQKRAGPLDRTGKGNAQRAGPAES